MKKRLEPYGNATDDIFYWIKEYTASKIVSISIDRDYTGTFNRVANSTLILNSSNIDEFKSHTLYIRSNGLKNLGSYTLALIEFYEFILSQKTLKSIKDFDATTRDIMFTLNEKSHKQSTQTAILMQINSLFKYIEKNNKEEYVFNLGKSRKKPQKERDEDDGFSYLKRDDLRCFLKELDTFPFRVKNVSKPKLMMKIALFGGLRGEEVTGIKTKNLQVVTNPTILLNGIFLRLYISGKGNKERTVYIQYHLIKNEYETYKADAKSCFDGLFFCTEANKKYTIHALYQQTRRILEYAGINKGNAGIHLLRRSYASFLATQDVDFAIIAELLGRTDSEVVELYVRIGKEGLRPIKREWDDP